MATALESLLKRISTMTSAVRGTALTPDLQRIYVSKMANDQSFTVVMFGMAQMQKLHADLRLLMQMVENHGLAIPDVKKVAESLLNGHENALRKRYDLTDAADLVRDAKVALLGVSSKEDWSGLLAPLSVFAHNVSHALAVLLPWHELSVAFEGARTVNRAYAERMVN
jgi:hypothetical protein